MKPDEIGPWSEVKLEILREYAGPYSRILANNGFHHGYIDAFSGSGLHVRKGDREQVLGSPLIALKVEPAFDEYHFIDLDGEKVAHLKGLVGNRPDVSFYTTDCNAVLGDKVLPRFTYEKRTRALCLLDPYKMTLDWRVVAQAGRSQAVEVFINFPIHHMNRNCKRENIADILPGELQAMDRFWGDRSWHGAMFKPSDQLTFIDGDDLAKQDNADLVNAYCDRLRSVAGFGFVARPLAMRNSNNSVVYYLIFAGPNQIGWNIVQDIFRKYGGG